MANHKMDLVRDMQLDLIKHLGEDAAKLAGDVLALRLADYEVMPACRELIVPETESEIMLRDYLATIKVEGRATSTVQRYNRQLRLMMAFVAKPTKQINTLDLRRYLAQMGLRGLKQSTVESERSILSAYFRWLHQEGLLSENPARRLAPIKEPKIKRPEFSSTDIDKIRDACENVRDRAIVEFLRATGCRISEVVALDRDSINWQSMECVVMGKGSKQRTVYIDEVAVLHVRRYLEWRPDSSPALFAGRGTKRLTQHGTRQMLNRIGEAAGVEHVHPHRFRRTLATNLARKGCPVQEIARILGHSNVETTMIYVNQDDSSTKSAYQRFTA